MTLNVCDCPWSAAVFIYLSMLLLLLSVDVLPNVMTVRSVMMYRCPVDYCHPVLIITVYPVSWWFLLILSWWKLLKYVLFVCWALACPFVYCHFVLFLQGDMLLSALEVVWFLELSLYPSFSKLFKCLCWFSNTKQSVSLLSLSSSCVLLAFDISFLK